MIGLEHYFVVSAGLFAIGLYGALSRSNVITVLMCIEIMFNAVIVAMVALSKFSLPAALAAAPDATGDKLDQVAQSLLTGQVFAVFIITVAAAEIALGLAIVMAIYRSKETVDLNDIHLMKW